MDPLKYCLLIDEHMNRKYRLLKNNIFRQENKWKHKSTLQIIANIFEMYDLVFCLYIG